MLMRHGDITGYDDAEVIDMEDIHESYRKEIEANKISYQENLIEDLTEIEPTTHRGCKFLS